MILANLSDLRLVLLPALFLASCSEAFAPGNITGTYELRSVGGRPVPAVYDSSAYGVTTVMGASFTFSADGQVLWTWNERVVSRASLQEPFRESAYSYHTTLPYSVRGSDLKIGDDCPPDPLANCAPPMPARLDGSRLLLEPVFSRAAWTFVRTDR